MPQTAETATDWVDVGVLDDIPRQGARVMRTSAGNIALFRTLDDDVYALLDKCPHKGGPLSQGIVYGRRVACPLHNWSIELTSGEAVAPDKGCVVRFPVHMHEGRIRLSLTPA